MDEPAGETRVSHWSKSQPPWRWQFVERSLPEKPAPPGVGAAAGPASQTAQETSLRIPEVLPVLPLRGTVTFPGTVLPLTVGRPASRRLLDEWLPQSKIIALTAQKQENQDEPQPEDLHEVGTAAMVLKLIRQQDDTVSIIVHGLARLRLGPYSQTQPYLKAGVQRLTEQQPSGKDVAPLVSELREEARQLLAATPNVPEQAMTALLNISEPGALADFLAANLNLEVAEKQALLEQLDVRQRLRRVLELVAQQLQRAKIQQKIHKDVQSSIGKHQRRMILNEQLKAIRKELGEDENGTGSIVAQLRKRLEEAGPPPKVMAEAVRDLDRLATIPSASPEFALITTYLELIADLPWTKSSADNLDLKRAWRILDRDHFDLDKVKRRLIEYLAVRKLNPKGRSPILCLVGPPGVGKTSLGQSVADALGRQFVRMSLGGIRDEAEIRGHRRTYIGAMPGRIIQEMRRAGTNNPVMMLDEVDKLGADFRGDPSAALLEVLDPRQNNAFVDRYLDVPFDLSQTLFIATANYMGTVPPALQDRLEVINIPGYTDNEKMHIARRYLVPRQLKENGLTAKQCRWTAAGVRKIINDYTREAGVRELERQIGAVCRGVAALVAAGTARGRVADVKLVRKMLGPERHVREVETRTELPGVAVGLAYTPVGGEILYIEATSYPGKGNIVLTGQLGEVMRESSTAAMSLFKTRAPKLGYDVAKLANMDVHIHVPAGAVPKDGPSAGVAIYTAICSLMLNKPVRRRLGMTGEITLRGLVLPIGGVKEKTLAAARAGLKTVLLPQRNRGDVEEIDPEVRKKLKLVFVKDVDEVLEQALGKGGRARSVPRQGIAPSRSRLV